MKSSPGCTSFYDPGSYVRICSKAFMFVFLQQLWLPAECIYEVTKTYGNIYKQAECILHSFNRPSASSTKTGAHRAITKSH